MRLTPTDSQHPLERLLLITPFFLWGTAMVAMKGVIPQTTPLFLATVRIAPAGLLVILASILLGRPQPQGGRAWGWIGLFALVDVTLFQGLLAMGLVQTGAGLGSVMIDTQPLAVALLALWFLGERIGVWGWLGLAIGITGISFIGLPDQWVLSVLNGSWLAQERHLTLQWSILTQLGHSGEFLMLLAALSMAVGTVMIRKVCEYADPVSATGWHMLLGGAPLLLGSSVWESEQWVHLSASAWIAMTYATIFGSAIAYGLFFYFAARNSLTSLSSLTFLTPVFALIFGNLLLSEVLSPLQFCGVCLTLVSIYLVNQRDRLPNLPKLSVPATGILSLALAQSPSSFWVQLRRVLAMPTRLWESGSDSGKI